MKRPFLLLTNDDGIHAPGLKHLWEAVRDEADVAIVAPQTEKSGCGLSITWTQPLHIHPVVWEASAPAWTLNGTPADCVKMALAVLLERKPDMIISGANRGSNAGRTVLYSGTVGGVIEGALKGIPGIAFSFSDETPPPLSATKRYIFPLIDYILKHPLPAHSILNVNFPLNSKEEIKGLRIARQGKSYWQEAPDRRIHPEGAPYYWLGGAWGAAEETPDTDVALLKQGYVTAAPIHVGELTCQIAFEKFKTVTEKNLIALGEERPLSEHSR
jgi:5'-nucleotidase